MFDGQAFTIKLSTLSGNNWLPALHEGSAALIGCIQASQQSTAYHLGRLLRAAMVIYIQAVSCCSNSGQEGPDRERERKLAPTPHTPQASNITSSMAKYVNIYIWLRFLFPGPNETI